MSSGRRAGHQGMTYTRLLAQAVVDDLEEGERWWTALLGTGPDERPMAGLLEWHLDPAFGVQVWRDPERAGRSAMVVEESDLDALAERLRGAGIAHDGPQQGGGARVLVLADPDGNQVVFTGA